MEAVNPSEPGLIPLEWLRAAAAQRRQVEGAASVAALMFDAAAEELAEATRRWEGSIESIMELKREVARLEIENTQLRRACAVAAFENAQLKAEAVGSTATAPAHRRE